VNNFPHTLFIAPLMYFHISQSSLFPPCAAVARTRKTRIERDKRGF
jgi:hypothetical protein